MKVFAYHFGATGVAWYRIWQITKYLQKRGVDIKRLPNESDRIKIEWNGSSNWPGIRNHREIAEEHDVIITQYVNTRSNAQRLVEQMQLCKVIVDIDDEIYSIHRSNKNWQAWQPQPDSFELLSEGEENSVTIKDRIANYEGQIFKEDGKTYFVTPGEDKRENVEVTLRQAHMVTVSTEDLKRKYSHLNSNIHVVPNGIDFDMWEPVENDTGQFRIAMTGSNTHALDWNEAAEGIKRFLSEYPDARLIMNSTLNVLSGNGQRFEDNKDVIDQFPDYFLPEFKSGKMLLKRPSEVEKYPAWLAGLKADVILAPLADITFNKYKSNIKYLEASALKIPTIAQDMEPYNRDIQHGVNGLLCKKPSDWYTQIKWVYEHKKESKTLANRAWMQVKNRYDMALIAEKYEQMLNNFVNEGIDEKASDRQPAFA